MMNLLISLLILSILPIPILSLTCDQIKHPSLCDQLSGCSWIWPDNHCVGNLSHSCSTSTTCYYIDPIDGSDTQSGSIEAPLKTLTSVLHDLQGKDATIFIINREQNIKVQLSSQIIIDSNLTIRLSPVLTSKPLTRKF